MPKRTWIVQWTLLCLILSGCSAMVQQEPQPTPPVPLRELLIDVSAFPPGWSQGKPQVSRDYDANILEALSIGFDTPVPKWMVAHHTLLWSGSHEHASQSFDALLAHDKELGYGNTLNSMLTYPKSHAQKMEVLCSPVIASASSASPSGNPVASIPFCEVLTQYGSYISIMTSYLDPQSMRAQDFERILLIIDQKLAPLALK